MNKTLKTDQIKNELVRYIGTRPKEFQSAVLSPQIAINQYTRTITKVKGHYPTVQALMSNVVQIFDSKKFTPYGEVHFLNKNLTNFHQKVDFELDPAEILGTWFEDTYDESKKAEQKTISKMAMQLLKAKVIDDVNTLSITGKYDAGQKGSATPTFGTSMDGLNEILKKNIANTTNPVFFIPGDAITSSNIIDVVKNYEKQLPKLMKPKIKTIFMSTSDFENYVDAYKEKYGDNKFYNNQVTSPIGERRIVGIPNLTKGTLFSTVDGNLLRLIDEIDNPSTITDVQVHDRILRVYGEFSLGYDFAVNQLLYIHSVDGTKKRGLNNAEQNKLIYPSEGLIV